jgi:hypothetical protein
MTFFCHPERSEGSQLSGKARFFAALRMTLFVFINFFNSPARLITKCSFASLKGTGIMGEREIMPRI